MRLTEEQAQVRDMVRRFADEAIRPVAGELDESERFPAEIYARMAGLGLFGIAVPAELGGAGLDTLSYALVMEELSRGYASVADQCGLVELIATLLSRHGTPAQRERYLAPLLRGERRCAYAITEAEAGSDVAGIRTTATRTPEGWRLDGGKLWIHNAPVCDFAVVLARTDPEAGRRGMSILIVDADRPGFSRGPKERKMGQRASPVGALHFDGVELPADALLGQEGRGFHTMMSVLDKGRVGIAALAVGIAQAGLEAAVGYARQRRQFGRAVGRVPGPPVHAGRHGEGRPGGAPSHLGRRPEARRRRARDHGLLDGQVHGRRRGGGADRGRRAGVRRQRLHPRVRGRAALPGRQDLPNLRGHEPNPAQRSSPASCCGRRSREAEGERCLPAWVRSDAVVAGPAWVRSGKIRVGFVRARPSPAAWVRSCKSSVGFVRATPDRGLGFGRASEGDKVVLLAGRVGHRTLRAGWAAIV